MFSSFDSLYRRPICILSSSERHIFCFFTSKTDFATSSTENDGVGYFKMWLRGTLAVVIDLKYVIFIKTNNFTKNVCLYLPPEYVVYIYPLWKIFWGKCKHMQIDINVLYFKICLYHIESTSKLKTKKYLQIILT